MSYLDNFEHSFMEHTLEIVQGYKGPFEATILINCLLGLLVVPKETSLEAIPLDPLTDLPKWGIRTDSIESVGKATRANPQPETIRGLVHNLRNSVAHFRLKPIPQSSLVRAFEFTDNNGMKATITLQEMRDFVEKLASHLNTH